MHALGAIVLGAVVDAVALLQLVLRHARHVVLHDLRRIGALGANARHLGGHRQPDCGGECGSGKQWVLHDNSSFIGSRSETMGGSTLGPEGYTFSERNHFYRCTVGRCMGNSSDAWPLRPSSGP